MIFGLILIYLMLIIIIAIKTIQKKIYKNKFKKFNKGKFMEKLTPTELGRKFKKNAKKVNSILAEIGFIKSCENGWKLTQKGKENGGIQNNYKGNLSVYWSDEILKNEIFTKEISDETESKDKVEIDFRKKFEAKYRTKSGHYVRSRAEVIIADWLYSEFICFAYEKRVPILYELYCDFYLPKEKIYIEFWGYDENKEYLERKNKKLNLYKQNELNLIEIDNNTINNLDDFLPKEILKFQK